MRNPALWIGSILCSLLLLVAIIGPFLPFVSLEEHPPYIDEAHHIIAPPFPPSEQFLLGTDADGVDMLSLLIVGAKNTLLLVFVIVLIRYLVAIPLAFVSINPNSVMNTIIQWWNHIFSGLPTLFAALLILNLPFLEVSQHRMLWVILIIALLEVGRVSCLFQQHAHDLTNKSFVESGIMIGNSKLGLYKRYILPFLAPHIVTNFVIDLGRVLLLLGQMAFLSVFVAQIWIQTSPESGIFINAFNDWTSLLAGSRSHLRTHLWIPFWPALAIALTIISINILGEGLREYYSNKGKSRYNPTLEKHTLIQLENKKESVTLSDQLSVKGDVK